ncbi:MAG: peptidoglycan-binding protein [Jaaginema sp. PMC 1079.18]|nr:peptidoglycan-binding protein [Jaaginema sp. PMC 1080.18]MEC4853625.1 peptidoglycan-binding protein [Jaaginema sp. PMC 1079.18]MEC4866950.1 peptidoglycan-binding protein [Jaaginema sp. PMC 1078.18]
MEILAYSQLALSYEEAQEGYENAEILEIPQISVKTLWKRTQCCALALGTVAVGIAGTTSQALALLKQGDRGTEVSRIQQRLQNLEYFTEEPTGYFGDVTENALKRFQRDRGLKPDGVLGPATQAALFAGETTPQDTNTNPNNTNDSPFNSSGFLSDDTESSTPITTAEATTPEIEIEEDAVVPEKTETTTATTATTDTTATASILKLRDRGDRVKQLQMRLEAAGFSPGEVDGIFGEQTREAVLAFQRSQNLTVDGIAGRETLSNLATEGTASETESQRLYSVTVKSS